MAEREERRGVDDADLVAAPEGGREVRRRLGRPCAREADRQSAGRVDPTAEHVRDRLCALLAGEEAAHQAGQPIHLTAEVVGATDKQHGDDRRAGGEERLEKLLLPTRQVEVGHVAALARGAPAEEAGLVAKHDHADLGVGRQRGGGLDVGILASEHGAAEGVGDLKGLREHLAYGADLHTVVDARVMDEDVHGERVAAEHRLGRVGAGTHDRNRDTGGEGQGPVVREQHDRAPGELQRQGS